MSFTGASSFKSSSDDIRSIYTSGGVTCSASYILLPFGFIIYINSAISSADNSLCSSFLGLQIFIISSYSSGVSSLYVIIGSAASRVSFLLSSKICSYSGCSSISSFASENRISFTSSSFSFKDS